MQYYAVIRCTNSLSHHGIKGMKWGVRRYQNEDGSLTLAGRANAAKMRISYGYQNRKLNKLRNQADVNAQALASKKFAKKAAISAGVGALAGTTSVGLKYLNGVLKTSAKAKLAKYNDEFDQILDGADQAVRNAWHRDKQAYDSKGNWTNKGYSDSTIKETEAIQARFNAAADRNLSERSAYVEKFNKGARTRETISKVANGVSTASLGYSAYNTIQSILAKKRTTEIGHAKAVAKYKAQVEKMNRMFAETKYSDLIPKKV